MSLQAYVAMTKSIWRYVADVQQCFEAWVLVFTKLSIVEFFKNVKYFTILRLTLMALWCLMEVWYLTKCKTLLHSSSLMPRACVLPWLKPDNQHKSKNIRLQPGACF
jgi:hypothetical protein